MTTRNLGDLLRLWPLLLGRLLSVRFLYEILLYLHSVAGGEDIVKQDSQILAGQLLPRQAVSEELRVLDLAAAVLVDVAQDFCYLIIVDHFQMAVFLVVPVCSLVVSGAIIASIGRLIAVQIEKIIV